jgi:hypothetical protein
MLAALGGEALHRPTHDTSDHVHEGSCKPAAAEQMPPKLELGAAVQPN